jgi:hypothetical protein
MVARAASMKPLFRIPYFEEDVRPLEVLGTAVGAVMAAIYITGDPKNWIVNNLFGQRA